MRRDYAWAEKTMRQLCEPWLTGAAKGTHQWGIVWIDGMSLDIKVHLREESADEYVRRRKQHQQRRARSGMGKKK